jgi:hypothetical protein
MKIWRCSYYIRVSNSDVGRHEILCTVDGGGDIGAVLRKLDADIDTCINIAMHRIRADKPHWNVEVMRE